MSTVFKNATGEAHVLSLYRDLLAHWPLPCRQHMVQTRQGPTFVLECGNADLPPLVLLHGTQANDAAWLFDLPLWSRHFRCLAIDVIGEAGLSAQIRPPLDGDAHALWLADVLDGLGLKEPVAWHGVSFGGFLALDFATRHPQRVTKLSLLCPAGIGRTRQFLLKYCWLLLLGGFGRRMLRDMVLGPRPSVIPEKAAPLIALMDAIGKAIKPRLQKIPQLDNAALARLTMPLQCVVGGKDVLLDSEETKARLQQLTPQARVLFLPDARHYVPGQSGAVLEFLLGQGG